MRVQEPTTEWRKFALAGYGLIFLTFGVAGGWAAVAKLDRAVVAPAFISTETNKKTVQHLEGGIVQEILVGDIQRGGDKTRGVDAGLRTEDHAVGIDEEHAAVGRQVP